MHETILKRLDHLIQKRGTSRKAVSEAISGEGRDHLLKNWFRSGSRTMPQIDSLVQVADILDCDLEYLVGKQDEIRRGVSIASGNPQLHPSEYYSKEAVAKAANTFFSVFDEYPIPTHEIVAKFIDVCNEIDRKNNPKETMSKLLEDGLLNEEKQKINAAN